MWVWFNILCDMSIQRKLREELRSKVLGWNNSGIIKGAVLTFHYNSPPLVTDSYYLCIDIPALPKPERGRTEVLRQDVASRIPNEIIGTVKEVCSRHGITYEIKDYEFVLERNNASKEYRDAPISEILRFASTGTEIALDVLLKAELGGGQMARKDFVGYVYPSLVDRLGAEYPWLREAFHFVCNPLDILWPVENDLWLLIIQEFGVNSQRQ